MPIPHDCRDGFLHAYWRRPRGLPGPAACARASRCSGSSSRTRWTDAIDRLAADLDSGEWERRNGELLELDELDLGYRLVVAELSDLNLAPSSGWWIVRL